MPRHSASSHAFWGARSLTALLTHSLLLFSSLTLVIGANTSKEKTTKCRVKRKNGQGLLVATNTPSPTTPTNNVAPEPTSMPTSTQNLNGTAINHDAVGPPPLPPFDYQNQKVRGVNLGGWFLMEPWITPSMFEKTGNPAIVDEYTFGLYQDRGVATAALQQHWATFYTEQDFIDIASVGLNHVRIPISYWSVPVAQNIGPYIPGAWPYILQALDWAAAHRIYVILDLHGAPGSQNGFDNSGQRTGDPGWAFDQAHIDQTLLVIETMAREVAHKVSVVQLLNELAGFRGQQWSDAARRFWQAGYDRVRAAAGNDVKVMIGDAFLGVNSWDGYMKTSQNVLMDLHVYQIFSNEELSRSWDDHVAYMCSRIGEFTGYASRNLWLVMGEWSAAQTDCCRYLNGRGIGARWDGTYTPGVPALGSCQGMTGSYTTFSEPYKASMRKYWEAQVTVAERVNGWVYWTWKAENADDWSYQKGVEAGYIPRNPDDRLYPNICG